MVSCINKPNGRTFPIVVGITIFAVLFFITSCKRKNSQEDVYKNNIREAGKLYLSNLDPTLIQHIDTVIILNADTIISSFAYASLMEKALTSMQANYEYEYKEAVFEDDERTIQEIELSMTEVEYMLEYFDMLLKRGNLSQNDTLLLWVSAQFVSQGQPHYFDYHINPDGTLHELDPFNNNLLDKEFAAE